MRINLKKLRLEAGNLTQEEMANRLGVSRVTYSFVESGKSKGSIDFWLAVEREFPEAKISELTLVSEV